MVQRKQTEELMFGIHCECTKVNKMEQDFECIFFCTLYSVLQTVVWLRANRLIWKTEGDKEGWR